MPITHVSDTARWVAVYRAMESERPDAIFRDPFARELAGERGEQIVREMKNGAQAAWSMIVRTAVMDELVLRCVAQGADCVLNLAAGLDARPFRLDLPSTLRWIDVDFPHMLDYKWNVLRRAQPRCVYETAPTDLTDAAARRALFQRVATDHEKVVVIAEGLLLYLEDSEVAALATDLHGQPPFQWWIIDLASPQLLQWMQKSWGKTAAQGNAPFKFAPAEGTAFFNRAGWHEAEFRSSWLESIRLNRRMRGSWLWALIGRLMSAKRREAANRMAGIVLLER